MVISEKEGSSEFANLFFYNCVISRHDNILLLFFCVGGIILKVHAKHERRNHVRSVYVWSWYVNV